MKKIWIFTIIVVILLMGILFIRFFSGEDNWICENGKWIKHGNPSSEMPSTPCDEIIGGQRDEHGCLGPAGYSWNETEKECVREWLGGEERYQIINFQTCIDADYPVMESYPRQCATLGGRNFIEEIKFCEDLCGDGVCQEIVCMAIGCPCAETKESCAEDCK